KLAGVWDAPAHRAVRDAFAATKHPRAADASAAVEATLDRYAGEWTRTAVDSCTATRIHRDQTEADMTLRTDCLDARLAELHALTELFAHADAALVNAADKAAHGLDAIAVCSNLATLRAPNALPADKRGQIDALN